MEIKQQKVAIIGNGLAAWMACAFIINLTRQAPLDIVVYPEEEGERDDDVQSVLPSFKACIKSLGLHEKDLIDCGGLEKLGTCFNYGNRQFNFVWGEYGAQRGAVEFQQLLVRMQKEKIDFDINQLSIAAVMMEKNFFKKPDINKSSIFSTYDYSYSFSTHKLKERLRKNCIDNKITISEKTVSAIKEGERSAKVIFSNGENHRYDFIVNASCNSLLINRNHLDDWNKFLPYRKVSSEEVSTGENIYASVVKLKSGFSWTKRQTNLVVGWLDSYQATQPCENSDDNLPSVYCVKQVASERVVNIGASAIQLPSPLFSPADLVWCALRELGDYYPIGQQSSCLMQHYNIKMQSIYRRMRDITQWVFIAGSDGGGKCDYLHCDMSVENRQKLGYFQKRGRIPFYEDEVFSPQWQVWLSIGLGLRPDVVDPLVMSLPQAECQKVIAAVNRAVVKNTAKFLSNEK